MPMRSATGASPAMPMRSASVPIGRHAYIVIVQYISVNDSQPDLMALARPVSGVWLPDQAQLRSPSSPPQTNENRHRGE
jgi:hypothetical protein